MEINSTILTVLIILSFIVVYFIGSWIKVYLFMWGAGIKGSSFKMTIAYIIGRNELK